MPLIVLAALFTGCQDAAPPVAPTRDGPQFNHSPGHGLTGTIAFESARDNPGGEIYSMNADGTGVTRLTNSAGGNGSPDWSPRGRQIAFVSFRDGNAEIYKMSADGTALTRLTNNIVRDSDPAWSPDGRQIAFASDRDGNFEVYVMNADGTAQTRLTDTPGMDLRRG